MIRVTRVVSNSDGVTLRGRSGAGEDYPVVTLFRKNDLLICDEEKTVGTQVWRKVRSCIRNLSNVPLPDAGVWSSDGTEGKLQEELSNFEVPIKKIASISVTQVVDATYEDGRTEKFTGASSLSRY